jgi:hypothetical protein
MRLTKTLHTNWIKRLHKDPQQLTDDQIKRLVRSTRTDANSLELLKKEVKRRDKKWKEISQVYVYYKEECVEGGEIIDPDDEWSSRTTEYWNSSITLVTNKLRNLKFNDYTRFDIPFKTFLGKTVCVVYVIYGSGSTFGCSQGHIDIIGVYETIQEADNVVKQINAGTYNKDGYNSWEGYFESLEYADVWTGNIV